MIIFEAEKFHHDLALQFGLLSYSCKNEKKFLEASRKLIAMIAAADETEYEHIFFDDIPDKNSFLRILLKTSNNISRIEENQE